MSGSDADSEITALLQRVQAGESGAAHLLLPVVYEDLRQIARARLRGERVETLDTTGLVHEAWLGMEAGRRASFGSREQYFGYMAQVMRHLLTDRARRRLAAKRQPDADSAPKQARATPDVELWLALDQGMRKLAGLNARTARVAELRLFLGLASREIGELLDVTERTVERDWLKARMLLGQWIGDV